MVHDLTQSTDEELVRLLPARDARAKAAFGVLVDRHHQWLVRYLGYMVGGQGLDPEDIAQEVFVRAYLAADRFERKASFKTWVRAIATRQAYNTARDATTRQRYEDRLELPHDHQRSAERAVASREALMAVLDELPYPYREILILRHVEELEIKDIARTLQIGVSAAKMRLSRARDAFWKTYDQRVSNA